MVGKIIIILIVILMMLSKWITLQSRKRFKVKEILNER
jgi:hypothetical protein